MNTEEKNPQTEAGTDPQTDAEPEASQETEKAEKKDKGGFGGKKAKAEKEAMQKKLEEAEEALKKQKDQFLRTAAEYDNYRKRTEREKAAIYSDATAAAVLEFLPVADNLERALEQQECSVEDLRKGVEMVQAQLKKAPQGRRSTRNCTTPYPILTTKTQPKTWLRRFIKRDTRSATKSSGMQRWSLQTNRPLSRNPLSNI